MYTLTPHAVQRIRERAISPDELAAALAGRCYKRSSGTMMHVDRKTRTAILFDPWSMCVVTVFKLKRKQVKRWCSKGEWYDQTPNRVTG